MLFPSRHAQCWVRLTAPRINSQQSIRIRTLENDASRLLAENLSLREQVVQLQNTLETHSQRPSFDDIDGVKDRLETKMQELGSLVAELGLLKKKPTVPPRRKGQAAATRRSSDERQWRSGLGLQEVENAMLPTIAEDKFYPRKTLRYVLPWYRLQQEDRRVVQQQKANLVAVPTNWVKSTTAKVRISALRRCRASQMRSLFRSTQAALPKHIRTPRLMKEILVFPATSRRDESGERADRNPTVRHYSNALLHKLWKIPRRQYGQVPSESLVFRRTRRRAKP